jgi:ABC-type spermidine/putrescine transport system permease subunit II
VYITIVAGARLAAIPRSLEEGARDLGDTQGGAIWRVVIPILAPALIGGSLIVFLLSFDDFVTSFFLAGSGTAPLPVFIYGMIRFGVSPEINAIACLMIAGSILLGGAAVLLMRRRR